MGGRARARQFPQDAPQPSESGGGASSNILAPCRRLTSSVLAEQLSTLVDGCPWIRRTSPSIRCSPASLDPEIRTTYLCHSTVECEVLTGT
jgi:hypothetical protein